MHLLYAVENSISQKMIKSIIVSFLAHTIYKNNACLPNSFRRVISSVTKSIH